MEGGARGSGGSIHSEELILVWACRYFGALSLLSRGDVSSATSGRVRVVGVDRLAKRKGDGCKTHSPCTPNLS